MRPLRVPRPLPHGGTIHLVAPSSPFDAGTLDAGRTRLQARGYQVSPPPPLAQADRYLAAGDEQRFEQLLHALTADGIDVVMAARGGYGATRLLPLLEAHLPELSRARPRWVVGFSDITALHAFLLSRLGWASVHGPVCTSLGREPAETEDHLVALLSGTRAMTTLRGRAMTDGPRVEGVLVGGNLAVLSALCGTPWMPPLEGGILLLEDITERPHRIDRMLTQLFQATQGLNGVRGVVLGHFTECDDVEKGHLAADTLRERLGGRGIPVLAGLPVGHVAPNMALIHGAPVALDARAGTLELMAVATTEK